MLLLSFGTFAQTVTPNPGPYTPMAQKYQYPWIKTTGGVWNTGKFVQIDSAQFSGITYVPDAPVDDSSTQAANTRWIRQNISPGTPGTPTSVWQFLGNYSPTDPTLGRIGFIDSFPLSIITDNEIRITIPDNGIKRSAGLANKVLMIDTITKNVYYADAGGGGSSTLKAKLPLYIVTGDTIKVYGVDSSYQNASITGNRIKLYRYSGDSTELIIPSGTSGGGIGYYLNGSISAGVGTYKQMNAVPVIGAGTDFSLAGNGLIAQFMTDAADPSRLEIPAGAWNFEMFFNASSSGGTPAFYVDLLKYDGSTYTSIATGVATPEAITTGTLIDLYLTSLAVPYTTLTLTDRLVVRVYIANSSGGRTMTLHTEDNTLCFITTTFVNSYIDSTTLSDSLALKQNLVTLTTTGTSGAATFNQGTGALNIPEYAGGSSSSQTVTEQKTYYRGEFIVGRAINTTTGAVTVTGTNNITDYLRVAGSESVTISVPNGYSNVTIYGWTYDTTLTAISEIRSNALIGTGLKTYTFTTPSNARFINIYTKYAGVDFGKALQIKSTNTITYNTPITPEQFTGSKSVPIQSALDFARFTSSPVVLTGQYLVDSTLIMSSGNWLHSDAGATLTLDSASKTNIIRNEAVANPNAIFSRGNTNIKITGNITIQGSKNAWGGYPATGVGTQYWRPIAVLLANVQRVDITDVQFKNTNFWALCFEQSRIGAVKNVSIYQDSSHGNQDGINFRRGSNKFTVENIKGVTWDDLIAMTNLKIGPTINILDTVNIFEQYATNLDIHDIIIKNVQRDTTNPFFADPNVFKSGILLLCEDGLKVHDITIDGISGIQQVQVGYSAGVYWHTTPATKNDMYNISISNTGQAKINFSPSVITAYNRPVKNLSLMNVAALDITGAANAVIPNLSISVYRKYTNRYPEYIDSMFTNKTMTDIAGTGGIEGLNIITKTVNTVPQVQLSNTVSGYSGQLRIHAANASEALGNQMILQHATGVVIMGSSASVNGGSGVISLRPDGYSQSVEKLRLTSSGVSMTANSNATAWLHLRAGTATAGQSPLKFATGVELTTPEAGVLETSGTQLKYSSTTFPRSRGFVELGRYVSTATSLTADEHHSTIDVTATGQTITLPTAVGLIGRSYTIKLSGAGTGTVATTSSQTIDGSTTYSLLAQYKYVTVKSTGANWIVIGNN